MSTLPTQYIFRVKMLRASERKKLKEENIQRLTEEYSKYFTESHNFEFVRRLGVGTGAVALLFKEFERQALGIKTRNIAVKFAFSEYEHRNEQADDEIENERRWLKKLQGSEHILKILDHEVDRSKVSRPALVLEYVEYGSIQSLCKRMMAHNIRAPNRVLWSMFLCRKCSVLYDTDPYLLPCIDDVVSGRQADFCSKVTRACIGFAYPPWQNGEQETIPADGIKEPSSIIHNDLHDENVLIGELTPNSIEHRHAPILKVRAISNIQGYKPCISIQLTKNA